MKDYLTFLISKTMKNNKKKGNIKLINYQIVSVRANEK